MGMSFLKAYRTTGNREFLEAAASVRDATGAAARAIVAATGGA